jgi:hypothetical protein
LRRRLVQHATHRVEALVGAEVAEALRLHLRDRPAPLVPEEAAGGAGPDAPVDAESRLAPADPPVGERIEERVAGHVCALARLGQDGGDRREEHEVVELAEQFTEQPGPDDLRAQLRPQLGRIEIAEEAPLEHGGGVDHAADRRVALGLVALEVGPQRPLVADVDGRDVDGGASALELADQCHPAALGAVRCEASPRRTGRQRGPPHQYEPAGALVDEPSRHLTPEPAEAARDEVAGVGPQPQGRRRGQRLAHEPGDEALVASVRHLVLVIGRSQLADQSIDGGGARGSRIEVDRPRPQVGHLLGQGAGQAAQRCLEDGRRVPNGLGAVRHDVDAGPAAGSTERRHHAEQAAAGIALGPLDVGGNGAGDRRCVEPSQVHHAELVDARFEEVIVAGAGRHHRDSGAAGRQRGRKRLTDATGVAQHEPAAGDRSARRRHRLRQPLDPVCPPVGPLGNPCDGLLP